MVLHCPPSVVVLKVTSKGVQSCSNPHRKEGFQQVLSLEANFGQLFILLFSNQVKQLEACLLKDGSNTTMDLVSSTRTTLKSRSWVDRVRILRPKTYATNWALSMTAPSGPFNEHMVDAITTQSTRSENVWTTVAWSISGEEGKLLDATITTKIHPGNI